MERTKDKRKILKIITLLFLFLLPISGLTFFHNHITTLVLVVGTLSIFILTLLLIKESRKNLKYLLLYYVICLIYLGVSYYRSKNFVSLVPIEYDAFSEAMTVLKLIMPITFMYSLYYQKLDKKDYFKVIKWWVLFIAGSIIITNLFKISLSSYGTDYIKYNIFEWNKDLYYVETASRGYFTYANQVAVIMIMLILVSVYLYLYENKRNIFYIFLLTFAMLMLGTRVSSLAGLLTLACSMIFYIFLTIYKREKLNKAVFILLVPIAMWSAILPFSPFNNRNRELYMVPLDETTEAIGKVETEEVPNSIGKTQEYSDKVLYVLDNYDPNYLPAFFFEEYYPIEYDEEFWYQFVKNNSMYGLNYRYIEKSIVRRMWKIDDKWDNILFGISNNRIQRVVNIESDFVLHYFAFGLLGSTILLFLYLMLIFYSVYRFFKEQSYYLFIFTTAILLFIFSAFLTGNIINSLFPTTIFAFVAMGISLDYSAEKVEKDK